MNNDKLPAGVYTCVFEIFAYTALLPPKITNETLITQVHGDSHYNVITFSHDRIDNQYTKVFIQFSSDGQLGGITFEMRYYGSRFNRFILFGFYSRVIAGKQNTHFNHDILSVTSEDDNREVLYFENMNMNKNKIKGLGDPVDDTDSANKKYVDSGKAKQDIAITDKANKSYVDSENAKQDIAIADKASKSHVENEIAKIPQQPQNVLLLDGSKAMRGDLDMGTKKYNKTRKSH